MSKMSAFEVHHHRPGSGFLNATLSVLKTFLDGITHGRQLNRDYIHLSAMSDPELQDMGISRSDIFAVVAGKYQRTERALVAPHKPMPESRSPIRLVSSNRSRPKESTMCQADETTDNEIDVRSLVPAKRHQKIFQLVDELAPGTSFVLVNDHDPKPLYYQLEAEYPRQFSWAYLQKGPEVWRVEIGRLQKAA